MATLSEENLRNLEKLKKLYPTSKSLTLPVLWMAQKQFGWISSETMKYIAGLLNLPVSHIFGVVTFYTMFNTKPVGKNHIQVCTNVSCMLRDAEKITYHLCERMKIKLGETTPDEQFTVTEVECLGACGGAPMMQVNEKYYENLTIEKVDQLLDEWAK